MSDDLLDEKKKKKQQKGKKRARKVAARKKKSSGKKDACYRKVKSRYKVWPSAYASGALVKCRKVGAKNWGNKSKNEEFIPGGESSKYGDATVEEMISKIAQEHGVSVEQIQDQFEMGVEEEMEHAEEEMIAQEITLDHLVEDPEYYSKLDKLQLEEIYIVEEKTELTPENLEKILRDEGGASGMDPFTKAIDATEEEIKSVLDKMPNVGVHEDGDYILEDDEEIKVVKEEATDDETQEKTTLDEKRKKRKKAGTESSKESNLRDWFKRKGAKGSKGGWVDCNAPDGKGGYKSCGRGSGEKRKRYPACRPTPSACKERGRGKSWGKKGSKRKRNEELLRTMVREEREKVIYGKTISEGLAFHIDNDMPIRDNVYRHGTSRYFSLVNEARGLWKEGKLDLDEEDIEIMESDLGQFGNFAGQQVPLDFPMMIDESLDEAKKKKKKDPPIGKPTKNTGGGKKYKVYVRNPKTGKIKKITYGDSKGGLKGNWNNAEARKSFASRHNCKDKKDRTKAGYWACRAHKDFGTNVPGRFW